MWKRKSYLIFGTVLLLCAIFPLIVRADQEAPPTGYTILTADKKHLFVMLPPARWRKIDNQYSKYPTSGLYLNDGSTTPLWRIDWYTYQVNLSPDGQYLVRWGPWARLGDNYKTLTIAFYQGSKCLKSYCVKDLIPNAEFLPLSVSHYTWLHHYHFDSKRGQLTLTTLAGTSAALQQPKGEYSEGTTYVFDITSGAIIKQSLPAKTKQKVPFKHGKKVTARTH